MVWERRGEEKRKVEKETVEMRGKESRQEEKERVQKKEERCSFI